MTKVKKVNKYAKSLFCYIRCLNMFLYCLMMKKAIYAILVNN